MRLGSLKGLAASSIAAGLVFSAVCASPSLGGDEPGLLGRIFRGGSDSNSNSNAASGSNAGSSRSSSLGRPSTPSPTTPVQEFQGRPALTTPVSSLPGGPAAPRITPKPRTNKAMTDADPIATRVSIGRSTDGSQFAMFLQIFADGTVIDVQGVHKIGQDAIKPLIEAVGSGELNKLKGYCGGPAGDFIENVQVVVYERAMGRLRANSFSFSGNPQGCDHSVHNLQKILDDIQAKISPGSPVASTTAPVVVEPAAPMTLEHR